MSLPFALCGWLNRQFTDGNGDPIENGSIRTLEAGTSNLKNTYADADTVSPTANLNPLPLDPNGRATMFLEPGLYDFEVMDEDDTVLYTVESVGDIGLTYLSTLGQQAAEGARDCVSGYTVLATDNTITVDSTAGADPCIINLQPAEVRTQDLTIVNLGTVALALTLAAACDRPMRTPLPAPPSDTRLHLDDALLEPCRLAIDPGDRFMGRK